MERRDGREWRDGWPVVAAGLVGMVMMALHVGPLGVLMKPLGDIFGWSRSDISIGLLIITFLQLIIAPFVALLIPRFGVRRIALVGTLIYVVGLGGLGFSTADIRTWWAGWTVMGLGLAGISPLVWTAAITRSFVRQRGLALSIALSGVGIATFATPLVSAFALESLGWRAPFFILAAFQLLIMLPAVWWLMAGRPEFAPYTLAVDETDKGSASLGLIRGVISNRRVWQVVLASLFIAASVGMITAHLQAILRDAGASATEAAAYYTVTGPSIIIGRLLAGVMLDRLPTLLVAALLFLLPGVSCLILLGYDGSAFWGIAACVIFGVGYGSETDVLAYLSARYFGERAYPLVYSLVYGVFGFGFGVAAVLGGAVFDHFASYDRILIGLLTGVALGILLVVTLGRPPRAVEPSSQAAA